ASPVTALVQADHPPLPRRLCATPPRRGEGLQEGLYGSRPALSSTAHERIRAPLLADSRWLAVARIDQCLGGQGIEPRLDARVDRVLVAARQIGAPDAAPEERIAREQPCP